MTTLNEMIEIIKSENPEGLRVGDEDQGYTPLTAAESDAIIKEWAQTRLAKLQKLSEEKSKKDAKLAVYSKLGLTESEIEAIIG
jgi:hypothetical protein